jgi:hypothetical protein
MRDYKRANTAVLLTLYKTLYLKESFEAVQTCYRLYRLKSSTLFTFRGRRMVALGNFPTHN